MYRQNSSLQEYVLVSTDAIEVEIFRKNDGDNWKIINYQAGDIIELKSVNLTVPIEQIYEDIIFEQDMQINLDRSISTVYTDISQ